MRIMPFMKRKNGVQFAGVGLDTGSGGGGGGGGGSLPDYTFDVEIDTGVKYNNKKLYRYTKKVSLSSPGAPGWEAFKFNNVDDVFIDATMSKVRFSGAELPINYYLTSSNYITAIVRRSSGYSYVECTIRTTFSGACDWVLTVFYTKTTD